MRYAASAGYQPPSPAVGWDADPRVPAWPGLAALEGETRADVCVVGLGGSGLAALDELASRGGLDVVGLDAGRVAAGAAGRNGGILSCGGAMSLTDPPVPLESVLELYRETERELARLADALGPDVVQPTGTVVLAGLPGPDRDEREALEREQALVGLARDRAAREALGLPVEDYDGPLGHGIRLPDNAVMNPVRRALGLATRAAARARLHEHTPVTAIRPGVVETEHGRVLADRVIVAVDGRLDLLLPQLADLVRTVRLQMLATEPGEPLFPGAFSARDHFDYGQQDREGRLLVGGGRDRFAAESETAEAVPTETVQGWIEQVVERIAGRPVLVTHRWAASVGFTDDGRALCIEADEGVVACGGYSGSGNLVGPVAARAAVRLALDGTTPADCLRSSR
ncbi:NAD(P)/FAD-dependent oxidoreductase [Actinomycetota bacterium]